MNEPSMTTVSRDATISVAVWPNGPNGVTIRNMRVAVEAEVAADSYGPVQSAIEKYVEYLKQGVVATSYFAERPGYRIVRHPGPGSEFSAEQSSSLLRMIDDYPGVLRARVQVSDPISGEITPAVKESAESSDADSHRVDNTDGSYHSLKVNFLEVRPLCAVFEIWVTDSSAGYGYQLDEGPHSGWYWLPDYNRRKFYFTTNDPGQHRFRFYQKGGVGSGLVYDARHDIPAGYAVDLAVNRGYDPREIVTWPIRGNAASSTSVGLPAPILYWGDGEQEEVQFGKLARHTYRQCGFYRLTLQDDWSGDYTEQSVFVPGEPAWHAAGPALTGQMED